MYDVTYEQILERMLSRVSDQLDKREGSAIFDTHSPTAMELQLLYVQLNTIISESYGDSASREFLIKRCRERGISPHKATHAILRGEFTPAGIDVTGQRFNIGSLNYIVRQKTEDGAYLVQCESPGIVGNQQLGAMVPIDYIPQLETAALTKLLIPGEDEEETEALRTRYFDSFKEKAFGGNVKDYLEKTNAIPGVGSAKVTRVWNSDLRPAEMIPSAAVKAWYDEVKPTLSGEAAAWLQTVFCAARDKKLTTGGTVLLTILDSEFGAASDTLIQTVQQTIDPNEYAGEGYGAAPIGHVVQVQSAKPHEIFVKTELTFEVGYGWENLQGLIEQAVSKYLLELRRTWAEKAYLIVRISQIETRLLSIEGIVDLAGTTLNGASENVTLGKDEVPVFGGVSA